MAPGANRVEVSPAVEVDETLLTHLKVQQENDNIHERQVWMIAGWCRATRQIRFVISLANRTETVLREFFQNMIRTNHANPTRVYTDSWNGYNFLSQDGYRHFRVNHAKGQFRVGLNTINHIEGFWSDLKREAGFDKGANCSTLAEVKRKCYILYTSSKWVGVTWVQGGIGLKFIGQK
jgi:hypothetical protein